MKAHSNGVKDFAQRLATFGAGGQRLIAKSLLDIEGMFTGRAAVGIGRHCGGLNPLGRDGVNGNNLTGGDHPIDGLVMFFSGNIIDKLVVIHHGKNVGLTA